MILRTTALFILCIAIAGCGSAPQGEGGAIAVEVIGAQSFNPRIAPGGIERFAVMIEGPGIATPLTAEFPGDAAGGIIEGVPVGSGRIIAVQAINANGAAIRAGEAHGVEVDDGLTNVAVELEAVPIFTNIADGAFIDNTRLVFRLFSDPAHGVVIDGEANGMTEALADASTGAVEIQLDASTGLGRCAPTPLPPGEYRFTVRDAVTGRSSVATVRLLDGSRQRGAPFVTAAQSGSKGWARVAPLGAASNR